MDVVVAWLPVIIVVAVFLGVGIYTTRSYSGHVQRVNDINDELVAINREMIAELREIKEILRDRK